MKPFDIMKRSSLRVVVAALSLLTARAGAADVRTSGRQLVQVVAEVVALDPETRDLTLTGPLGGEISAIASPQVKNLGEIKVGDLVNLTYYESVTLSARRKGAAARQGDPPHGGATSSGATVRVLSVDPARNFLLVEGANGKLFSTRLERPELFTGLAAGDELEVVMARAVAVSLSPAKPGTPPPPAVSTLVIDRGDVLKQVGNTLLIRNARGRTFKITVDPRFKFLINGQLRTVYELQPGIRLFRTSFQVMDVEYVAPQ